MESMTNPEMMNSQTVDAALETLNSQYPPESFGLGLHPEDLKSIKNGEGLEALGWMSILRNSDLQNGRAEGWLGKQVIEPAIKAGEWVAIRDEGNIDHVYRSGYLQKMTGTDGNFYAVPTAKLAEFVQSRVA